MRTPPPAPRALKYIWAGTLSAVVAVTVVLEIARPDHPAGDGLLRIIEALWCATVGGPAPAAAPTTGNDGAAAPGPAGLIGPPAPSSW